MFVTAATELKFSRWPADFDQDCYDLSIQLEVVSVSWSRNNAFLMFLEQNGRPEILSLKEGYPIKPIHIITAIDYATTALFSRNRNKIVAIGTESSTVALYDTQAKAIGKLYDMPGPVVAMDFNSNDKYLAVICRPSQIVILNLGSNLMTQHMEIVKEANLLRFHPLYDEVLGVATQKGRFYLYNVGGKETMWDTIVATTNKINDFAFYPCADRNELITVDEELKFSIYETLTGKCTYRCCLPFVLTAVDYSADGKFFAVAMENGSVWMFNTKNSKTPVYQVKMHSGRIHCLKFSNDTYKSMSKASNSSEPTSDVSFQSQEVSRVDSSGDDRAQAVDAQMKHRLGDDITRAIKDELVKEILEMADNLSNHMHLQIQNLREYVRKEFNKVEAQMEEKWDMMNLVRASCKFEDYMRLRMRRGEREDRMRPDESEHSRFSA